MTNYKATAVECKNYRKSISSLKALRLLFSGGLLNLMQSASRKSKRLQFVCWNDCSIFVLLVISSYH